MNSRVSRVSDESIARKEPTLLVVATIWRLVTRRSTCSDWLAIRFELFRLSVSFSRRVSPGLLGTLCQDLYSLVISTLRSNVSIISRVVFNYVTCTLHFTLHRVKQRADVLTHCLKPSTFQKQRNTKKLARFVEKGSRNDSIVDLKFTSIDILQTTCPLVFEF